MLRPEFLREILFQKPYSDAIPFEGVHIRGAYFTEQVTLARGHLNFQLQLEKCRFEMTVDLANITADKRLSLNGSHFEGSDVENPDIQSSLNRNCPGTLGDVNPLRNKGP
jgi:hypothetical protein